MLNRFLLVLWLAFGAALLTWVVTAILVAAGNVDEAVSITDYAIPIAAVVTILAAIAAPLCMREARR